MADLSKFHVASVTFGCRCRVCAHWTLLCVAATPITDFAYIRSWQAEGLATNCPSPRPNLHLTLGINLRRILKSILSCYIAVHWSDVTGVVSWNTKCAYLYWIHTGSDCSVVPCEQNIVPVLSHLKAPTIAPVIWNKTIGFPVICTISPNLLCNREERQLRVSLLACFHLWWKQVFRPKLLSSVFRKKETG